MAIKLLESVNKLIATAESLSGKGIRIFENNDQIPLLEILTPKERDNFIYISCKKNPPIEVNHLLASRLLQIIRSYSADEIDRKTGVAYEEHLINAKMAMSIETPIKPHLEIALNDDKISSTWILSLINQLISQPVSINIERIIFKDYPELRKLQFLLAEKQFKDFNATLTREMEKLSPSIIFETSAIMNYVYLRSLDDLIGSNFINKLNFIVKPVKSVKLYEYTRDNLKNTLISDTEITNYWANFLGLENWFKWDDEWVK